MSGLQCVLENIDLLNMVLHHFTLQEAGQLLAGTCRPLAEIVRQDTITWKAWLKANDAEDGPNFMAAPPPVSVPASSVEYPP
jgi:hypothetical protein